MFGYAHIFPFFIVVCNHLKCYTTYDHFVICALCENKKLKKLMNLKNVNNLWIKEWIDNGPSKWWHCDCQTYKVRNVDPKKCHSDVKIKTKE
jgi:hypothetical protein